MHQHVKENRALLLFSWLLLFPLTGTALPPSDSLLTIPTISADGTSRAHGTIRIFAVMVEFQKEDNRFTSGNGTFDLDFLDRDGIIIDPLPHDRGYFEAHLEFAENYFHTVSGGRLSIDYEVFPDVIRLDKPMRSYAPLGETDEENYKLAHLARDAWAKVAETHSPDLSGYDPDRTMFIVFHAGSGRNIELMGTSLDKTPQDIPSVFLGTNSIQRLLEQPDFDGFDVGDPDVKVTNTAILPQTQSRRGEDVTRQEYVLQLSINGILTANIGSFIGLPDLFNTETGASGIGRFGLMDGASMFSYLGLFPPEPSAWEKIHLGWNEPFDISLDSGEPIELPAVSLREPQSIARHAISSDEYFLVENRHRNPDGKPLEVTIRKPDGEQVTRTIEADDERFDPFDDSGYEEILEPGVVVNLSNFDWSLPGGPDNDADRILNGGMLIWHIDEAVIRRKIDDNRINANSERRGVQLVEADGARDIGRSPGRTQTRFTNGHAFDFWWSGNDFTVITATGDSIIVYQENGNRFGPDTRPSNESNTGSPSFFEFYDFSDNLDHSHFFARSVGGDYVQPVTPSLPELPQKAGLPQETEIFPVSPNVVRPNSETELLVIPAETGFYSIPLHSNEQDFTFLDHPRPSSPLLVNDQMIAGQWSHSDPSSIRQEIRSWVYGNDGWMLQWQLEDQPAGPGLLSLETDGTITIDRTPVSLETDGNILPEQEAAVQRSGNVDGLTALIRDGRFELSDGSFFFDPDRDQLDSRRLYTGNLRFSADSGPSFFILTDNRFDLVDRNHENVWEIRTFLDDTPVSWPAFADFNGDQSLNILITDHDGSRIHGYYRDGGLLDFFPLHPPRGNKFVGSPLIVDITGDGHNELITAAQDSITMTVRAYDRNLEPVAGFPLTAGSLAENESLSAPPMIIDNGMLFAVSPSGEVRAWELPELGDIEWGQVYGSQTGNKAGLNVDRERSKRADFGLLNDSETYNWPNPADDHTHIRFETSESAGIGITVINQSGSTVYQTQVESQGRYPQEVRLNTSSWGNGVYFARIQARNGGSSETKLIKIVVTH